MRAAVAGEDDDEPEEVGPRAWFILENASSKSPKTEFKACWETLDQRVKRDEKLE